MRKILNTLFITQEDIYLSLENHNLIAWKGDKKVLERPLVNLEGIVYCGYKGASPALLGECANKGIAFCFLSPQGKFLARINATTAGSNILLRKEQFRISDAEDRSLVVARNMIVGKILNARKVLMRAFRDHRLSFDAELFDSHIQSLLLSAKEAAKAGSLDLLRGVEGNAAQTYFALFDQLILQDKKHFVFNGRNKRPPLDPTNALLSFTYTILVHDCASALETAGLDSYAGFLHRDRAGRCSLALDLMEELRAPYADRFVLLLINNRIIQAKHFKTMESGAVLLSDEGKRIFFTKWYEKKLEKITHPYLNEKMYWGLIPYVQALLLARYIRGDLDGYPPYTWK